MDDIQRKLQTEDDPGLNLEGAIVFAYKILWLMKKFRYEFETQKVTQSRKSYFEDGSS